MAPAIDSDPIVRKSRRETPSQNERLFGFGPKIDNMDYLLIAVN